ncbi:hypothetical protein ANAEL_01600 [Anaerolineales bacterium]|nr:hypothetical protein ANAEL_01600 [Anaerolineales bacterium]
MANDELDPRLIELLDKLKSVLERDTRAALRGKNKFLAEAVSLSESRRHSRWTTIFQIKKEKFAMNLLVSALVIAGLLFGGNATVAASQDALPTDALYQIKLLAEETRLFFNTDPAVEVELLMQQAQARTQEMAALNAEGVTPPDALVIRTQDRIHQALEVTATLDETDVADTLSQIRDQLKTQDRLLDQLRDGSCADCEPVLDQTRDMLRDQLRDVEDGLADPAGFVHRHRNQNGMPTPEPTEAPVTEEPTEIPTEEPVATVEPIATETPVIMPQASCTPALDGTGLQNGNMGTSQPQNGNGEPPADPGNNGEGNGQQNGGKP